MLHCAAGEREQLQPITAQAAREESAVISGSISNTTEVDSQLTKENNGNNHKIDIKESS